VRWPAFVVAPLLAVACGGAQSPAPAAPAPAPAPEQSEEPTVSTETYAAISAYFGRHQTTVSMCYADALTNKKVDPTARGYVTVALAVPPNGRPQNVRVAEDTLGSEAVGECIVKLVQTWLLPKPATTIDFTFSYNFVP